MRVKDIIHAALALSLVVLPSVALADTDPTNHNYNNGQYNNGQTNNGQWNNRRHRNDGDDRRDRDDRDQNGDNGQYGNDGRYGNNGYGNNGSYGNGGYNNGSNGGTIRLTSTVSGYSGYDLDVNSGPHIRLHQGTVINPTGITLQRGMRINVTGHGNSDGSFEADRIDVLGNRYGKVNNGNNTGLGSLGNLGNLGNLKNLGNLSSVLGNLKI